MNITSRSVEVEREVGGCLVLLRLLLLLLILLLLIGLLSRERVSSHGHWLESLLLLLLSRLLLLHRAKRIHSPKIVLLGRCVLILRLRLGRVKLTQLINWLCTRGSKGLAARSTKHVVEVIRVLSLLSCRLTEDVHQVVCNRTFNLSLSSLVGIAICSEE